MTPKETLSELVHEVGLSQTLKWLAELASQAAPNSALGGQLEDAAALAADEVDSELNK